MKSAAILLFALVVMADSRSDVDKRSLSSTLAQHGMSFDSVIARLGSHLHAGMTISDCTATCKANAVDILHGSRDIDLLIAPIVCQPLCEEYRKRHPNGPVIGRR